MRIYDNFYENKSTVENREKFFNVAQYFFSGPQKSNLATSDF